jgi:hypothetical protein
VSLALLLLSACGSTPPVTLVETETIEVKVPFERPIPEALLEDCLIPPMPDRVTVGAAQDLIAQLYVSLWLCEDQRQVIEDRQPTS